MTGAALSSLLSMRITLEQYIKTKEKKRLSKKATEILESSMYDTTLLIGYIAVTTDETPEDIISELSNEMGLTGQALRELLAATYSMVSLVAKVAETIEHKYMLHYSLIKAAVSLLEKLLQASEGGSENGSERAS